MAEILKRREQMAKKEHWCELCGTEIHEGEHYIRRVWIGGDEAYEDKLHIQCDALVDGYCEAVGVDAPETFPSEKFRQRRLQFTKLRRAGRALSTKGATAIDAYDNESVREWVREEACGECDSLMRCASIPMLCPYAMTKLLPPALLTHEDVKRYLQPEERQE